MTTTPTWQQDTSAKTDYWRKYICEGTRCCATQYEGSDDYCWQVYRNDFYLGGVITDRAAAIAKADEMLAMPIEEYNALVAANLRDDLCAIERKLLALQPNADLLPGYHAGFKAGVADMQRKVKAVLE